MRTRISVDIFGIFLIGAVFILASAQSPARSESLGATSAVSETINPGTLGPVSGVPASKTFTLANVASHAAGTSCWTAINGKVYDVTAWISQHPGGANAIIGMCGKDASDAFNGQHGGQRRPASELAGFIIGSLAGAPTGAGASGATVPVRQNNSNDDD